ncbi:MAG: SURF1 family protein [Alphaproteobacteria bacterium]|nr:SURF1 family protein [Rhodospirillales bacterium]MCW9044885.1 SURF1 family protein [Alphaproteobacteria bacterium]
MTTQPSKFPMGFLLVTVFLLVILCGLGSWQLINYNWQDKVITFSSERLQKEPVPLKDDMGRPWEYAFNIVKVKGTFLHDKELFVTSKVHEGKLGFDLITPLKLETGTILFVDRGWIPLDKKEASERELSRQNGMVEVVGAVMAPAHRGLFRPANDPLNGKWYGVDPRLMAQSLSIEKFRPFYLQAGPFPNPGGLPIGGYTPFQKSDRSLIFAIAWFVMAFGVLIVIAERVRRHYRANS